jgi:hypothetical protein
MLVHYIIPYANPWGSIEYYKVYEQKLKLESINNFNQWKSLIGLSDFFMIGHWWEQGMGDPR